MRFYFGKYTGLLQFGDPPKEEKNKSVDDSWRENRKKKCCCKCEGEDG